MRLRYDYSFLEQVGVSTPSGVWEHRQGLAKLIKGMFPLYHSRYILSSKAKATSPLVQGPCVDCNSQLAQTSF